MLAEIAALLDLLPSDRVLVAPLVIVVVVVAEGGATLTTVEGGGGEGREVSLHDAAATEFVRKPMVADRSCKQEHPSSKDSGTGEGSDMLHSLSAASIRLRDKPVLAPRAISINTRTYIH